ncbi:MAG: hypothetical protein AB7J40_02995 [Candidatus Altimarinota bacterium]
MINKALANNLSLLPGSGNLADKIRSGDIHLSDIPAFISYFIEIAIIFAGMIAFLMIIVGGYQYIVGGIYSDMREQGKTTLIYAISGFVLSLLAYAIVNLVQLAATGL